MTKNKRKPIVVAATSNKAKNIETLLWVDMDLRINTKKTHVR